MKSSLSALEEKRERMFRGRSHIQATIPRAPGTPDGKSMGGGVILDLKLGRSAEWNDPTGAWRIPRAAALWLFVYFVVQSAPI